MKINKIFVLILLFCSATVFTGCAKREIQNIDSKGKNIICFGDSITYGYGAGLGEDYPSALGKLIAYPVINCGVDGDTSTMALDRLKIDVLDKNPRLVLIEFAGNDFIKKLPMEKTVENIENMIDQIQAQGAMAALVDISAGLFLKDYRVAYKKIAQEKNAIFIPGILNGIITNPSMKSDFLHPNAFGYQQVAKKISSYIKPYLKD